MPIRKVTVNWFSLTELATNAGITPSFPENNNQITIAHVAVQAVRDQLNNQNINPFDTQYKDYIVMNAEGKITSLLNTPLVTDESFPGATSLTGTIYYSLNCTSLASAATDIKYNPTTVPAVDGELALLTRGYVNTKTAFSAYMNHYDALYKEVDSNNTVTLSHSQYSATKLVNQPKNTTTYVHKVYWLNEEGVFIDVTDDSKYCNIPTNGTGTTAVPDIEFSFCFLKDGMYAVYTFNNKGIGYNAPGSWCLVNCNVAEAIDETKLQELQTLVTTLGDGYYQTDDRWNGGDTYCADGFWATYMKTAYDAACGILQKPLTNQSVVDAISELNEVDKSKLIPVNQINATALYEALQSTVNYSWDESSALYLGNYTSGTAAAFDAARENAQTFLDSLFSDGVATEVNIAANQSVADGYASTLLTARNNLLPKDLLSDVQKYRDTIEKLDTLFGGLASSHYETESWNSFAAARTAAAELLSDHPVSENLTRTEYDEYVSAARNYWLAAYGLQSKNAANVTLVFSDDFGMRYPEYALSSSYEETLTLSAGTSTLKQLLTQAGLATLNHLGYSNRFSADGFLWDDWLVYINGILIRDPKWTDGDTDQTILLRDKGEMMQNRVDWNDVCVRDGDVVTLVRCEAAMKPTYVGGESAAMEEKLEWFGQIALHLDKTTIKEGETAAATISRMNTYLPDYDGRSVAYPYASLAAYGPQKEDGTYPTEAILMGSGDELVLNRAGIYLVTAFEGRAQDVDKQSYPNLRVGCVPVTVTVVALESDELQAAKEEYLAELDNAYRAYSEDYYTEDNWAIIIGYYENAQVTISTASSLDDMKTALDSAVAAMAAVEAIDHESVVALFAHYLKYLPSIEQINNGYFTKADQERMSWIIELYGSMSAFQKELLTPAQQEQYNALITAYGEDGSGLPDFEKFTVTVSVDENDLIYSEASQLWAVYYDRDGEWSQLFDGVGFQNGNLNNGMIPKITVGTDARHKTDALWLTVNISKEYLGHFDGIEIADAVVDSVSVEELQFFNRYTYFILTPYHDITIRVKSVQDSLQKTKNDALAELEAALNGYNKSDYTSENWSVLTAAYSTGVAAINTATSENEVTTAKQTALDDMAAVEKKLSGDLGSVTVIVENTTYDDAASTLSGEFVSKTVNLTEQSTMMKCVLTALAEKGYSWTGTGGKGYDITYLSSIYIDANGNGKKDSDEKSLGEFDAGPQSGWMGTLNDWFVNEGFNMFAVANGKLKDGDVIRVQYTVSGYGTDLGATWANNDTSLKELAVDGGSFGPEFNGSVLEYVLTPGGGSVSFLPTAANKNFQVRIFLNQQNKNANAEYYRQGESIPVKSGDVIWIGVGENSWGSMNEGAITGTWYKLNVVSSDDANAVVKLINAIGNVTYSNYETKQTAVDLARAAYGALNSTVQSSVTNLGTLESAETAIAGYQKVDALKAAIAALPRNITEADREAVEAAKEIYDDLAENAANLLNLLSVAETNKLLEAVNALTEQPKSDDAGVKSIKVNGVKATGSGTSYAVTLPIGSDVAAATFEIEPADKANVTDGPTASDGGTTWSFTVTAEDGVTSETYTVTLTVSQMEVNVLECAIYSVTDDVTVVDLSPVVMTGLREAVKVEELGLPETAQSVSLWLKVTAVSKNGSEITVKLEPMFAVDGGEEQPVPANALIGSFTVTLPISCTANAKVLYGTTNVNATGSDSGITFTAPGIGSYTIIPDAQIQGDIPAIGNGSTEGTTENGVTTFAAGTAADAPTVSVAAPEGGWTMDGTTANSFTVSCENDVACVVLVKSADGSYTRLIAENAGTTHTFHTALNSGDELVVVRKGDISGDGKLSGPEVTQIKATQLGFLTIFTELQNLVADLDGDGELRGPEVTQIKAAQLGFLELTW